MRTLMDPTTSEAVRTGFLLNKVREQESLRIAWIHVSERAKSSRDPKTRQALAEFHLAPTKKIAKICKDIGANKFRFEAQKGVASPRSGGKPARPIVVAPIVNRIVQRAILNLCQSKDMRIRSRLGLLPEVVDQATSVGGLPERGVPEAVSQISDAISAGAKWFIRSDLKNFFQHIPKALISKFLEENVSDADFNFFFMKALETELENEVALKEDLDLFPLGGIGVPQGSALSALCSNIVLHKFDKELNGRGIVTIRYLDDFVILGPTKKSVDACWLKAVALLDEVGLEPHPPDGTSDKAAKGEVKNGFDFLSVHFCGNKIEPSKAARNKILGSVKLQLSESKAEILRIRDKERRAEPRFLQTLVALDKIIRGWGDAFRFSNHRLTFMQLDTKIDEEILSYRRWFGTFTKSTNPTRLRRLMGVALLQDTPRAKHSELSARSPSKAHS
jgi:RNA-directed DNA polymerase